MARLQAMSSVDAAWLQMEQPANLMMITGVLWFRTPVDPERLRSTLERRFLATYPRFTQKLGPQLPLAPPLWVKDADFDLENHLTHIALPGKGDRESLERVASRLLATPLDRDRPLWHVHHVEGYRPVEGEPAGDALIVRIHHCIADGMALAKVLLALTDEGPDGDLDEEFATPRGKRRPVLDRLTRNPELAARTAGRAVKGALRQAASNAARTVALGREWVGDRSRIEAAAMQGAQGALSLARLLVAPADPATPFRGKLGVPKRAVWTDPIPLARVKALGKQHGATLNDVLVAAVAGAMRRHLEEAGQSPVDLRACIPFNLRPADAPIPRELGNRFGLVFLALPVGESTPLARLRAVKQRMDALKRSPEAAVTYLALNALGLTPPQVEQAAVGLLGEKATCVLTNVPGPKRKVWLAGSRLEGLTFWVPQSGRVGLGISILSYGDDVTVALASDAKVLPAPRTLLSGVLAELDALEAEAPGGAN